MRSGLLWYDNSAKPLTEKIQGAAKRYCEKFGVMPDTCFVNPNDLPQPAPTTHDNITIATKITIMPNHVWLGISGSATVPTQQETNHEQEQTQAAL